VLFSKIVKIQV